MRRPRDMQGISYQPSCNRLLLQAPHLPDYITSAPNGTLSDKAGCREVVLGLLAWGPVGALLWRSGIPHVNLFVASILREWKNLTTPRSQFTRFN
jgi:hypothetical protein